MWYEALRKISGIKPSERIATSYWNDGDLQYIVTKDLIRPLFFLYEVTDGIANKTKYKNENPNSLEDNIIMI